MEYDKEITLGEIVSSEGIIEISTKFLHLLKVQPEKFIM